MSEVVKFLFVNWNRKQIVHDLGKRTDIVMIVPGWEGMPLDAEEDPILKKRIRNHDGTKVFQGVFTVDIVKGLEFEKVVVYRFAHDLDAILVDSVDMLLNKKILTEVQRIKLEYFLNSLYISCTRAKKGLFILEPQISEGKAKRFWDMFRVFAEGRRILQKRTFRSFGDETIQKWAKATDIDLDGYLYLEKIDALEWREASPSEQAREYFEKGLAEENPFFMVQAGWYFQQAGENTHAFEAWGHGYEFQRDYFKAGNMYLSAGKLEKAENCFLQALTSLEDDAEARKKVYAEMRKIGSEVGNIASFLTTEDSRPEELKVAENILRSAYSDSSCFKNIPQILISDLSVGFMKLRGKIGDAQLKRIAGHLYNYYKLLWEKGLHVREREIDTLASLKFYAGEFEDATKLWEMTGNTPERYWKAKLEVSEYPETLVCLQKLGRTQEVIDNVRIFIDKDRRNMDLLFFQKNRNALRSFVEAILSQEGAFYSLSDCEIEVVFQAIKSFPEGSIIERVLGLLCNSEKEHLLRGLRPRSREAWTLRSILSENIRFRQGFFELLKKLLVRVRNEKGEKASTTFDKVLLGVTFLDTEEVNSISEGIFESLNSRKINSKEKNRVVSRLPFVVLFGRIWDKGYATALSEILALDVKAGIGKTFRIFRPAGRGKVSVREIKKDLMEKYIYILSKSKVVLRAKEFDRPQQKFLESEGYRFEQLDSSEVIDLLRRNIVSPVRYGMFPFGFLPVGVAAILVERFMLFTGHIDEVLEYYTSLVDPFKYSEGIRRKALERVEVLRTFFSKNVTKTTAFGQFNVRRLRSFLISIDDTPRNVDWFETKYSFVPPFFHFLSQHFESRRKSQWKIYFLHTIESTLERAFKAQCLSNQIASIPTESFRESIRAAQEKLSVLPKDHPSFFTLLVGSTLAQVIAPKDLQFQPDVLLRLLAYTREAMLAEKEAKLSADDNSRLETLLSLQQKILLYSFVKAQQFALPIQLLLSSDSHEKWCEFVGEKGLSSLLSSLVFAKDLLADAEAKFLLEKTLKEIEKVYTIDDDLQKPGGSPLSGMSPRIAEDIFTVFEILAHSYESLPDDLLSNRFPAYRTFLMCFRDCFDDADIYVHHLSKVIRTKEANRLMFLVAKGRLNSLMRETKKQHRGPSKASGKD